MSTSESHLNALNPQQRDAVMTTNGPLLILAGAGAGKTKTITHRILHLIEQGVAPQKILAITFTNKAAKEMRERVAILLDKSGQGGLSYRDRPMLSTFHSLGVEIIKENAERLGLTRHFGIFDKHDGLVAIKEALREAQLDPKQYEPSKLLNAISRKKGDGISLEKFNDEVGNEYFSRIVANVWEHYEKILAREKSLDFDDLLLKTGALLKKYEDVRAHYQERWSHVHIDEYQDTNKVQYDIAKLLAEKHHNICVVGDIDQCLQAGTQITMADGTQKAIESIKAGDGILSNYGSGDFRPATVSDVFAKPFSGELVTINTSAGRTLTSTPEHIHFAGYRLGVTPQLYFTYLMFKRNVGYRIGTSQVYTNGQKRSVVGFRQRCQHEHGDAVWVIAAHSSPNEARTLEYQLSLKYQLPTLPFVARKGKGKNGMVHDQQTINQIFASFPTAESAEKLLQEYRLSLEHPHHRAQSRNSNRHKISISLCGDRRGASPMHRISIIGNDEAAKKAFQSIGLSVRPAKAGSNSWRIETGRTEYGELAKIIEAIQSVADTHIVRTARLGGEKTNLGDGNSLPFLPAGSVLPGMALFNEEGGYDIVEKVTRASVTENMVYDLNIAKTHNFIANGIITHNSIYSWRGADIQNILRFEKDYPEAKTILLEENYRSTQTILSAANEIIKKNKLRKEKNLFTKNGEGEKITLYSAYDENDEASFVADQARSLIKNGANPQEIAVLYRANFQSRAIEEAFLSADVPYQVLGVRFFERKEVKDVLAFIKAGLNPDGMNEVKRIINVPPRGIGQVTLLKMFSGTDVGMTAAVKKKVADFRQLLANIGETAKTMPPSHTIKYVLKETGIEDFVRGSGPDGEDRLENIKELVTLATKYDTLPAEEGIEKLLSDAALASDQDELGRSEKELGVRLMTVHASKGLEFDNVFITGLEQDVFPHRRYDSSGRKNEDSEEERRLFYVALTRARTKLFLTYASMRTIFGSKQIGTPSEFIMDIDDQLIEEHRSESRGKIIYLE